MAKRIINFIGLHLDSVEIEPPEPVQGAIDWGIAPAPLAGPRYYSMSAAWASKTLNCTLDGILNACHGRCCYGPTFWPGKSGGRPDNACALLGPEGCTFEPKDKPVTCHLFPMRLNKSAKLVGWMRMAQTGSCCFPNYGTGPTVVEAIYQSLIVLFGESVAEYILREVQAGRDPVFEMPADVAFAIEKEDEWEAANLIPRPRSLVWAAHQKEAGNV